jgi:hypothetical protein
MHLPPPEMVMGGSSEGGIWPDGGGMLLPGSGVLPGSVVPPPLPLPFPGPTLLPPPVLLSLMPIWPVQATINIGTLTRQSFLRVPYIG